MEYKLTPPFTWFLIGLVVGGTLTYIMIDKNYDNFVEPKIELSKKIEMCNNYADFYLNEYNNNYTAHSIVYFKCIQKAYGFEKE